MAAYTTGTRPVIDVGSIMRPSYHSLSFPKYTRPVSGCEELRPLSAFTAHGNVFVI